MFGTFYIIESRIGISQGYRVILEKGKIVGLKTV